MSELYDSYYRKETVIANFSCMLLFEIEWYVSVSMNRNTLEAISIIVVHINAYSTIHFPKSTKDYFIWTSKGGSEVDCQ